MKVVELSLRPQHLERDLDWHLGEWPDPGKTRETTQERIHGSGFTDRLPLTLILESDTGPVGYISLVFWEGGRAKGRLHWIDAVYVDVKHRNKGLASKLITAAEVKAASLGIPELFALTDLPELYRKLEWTPVEGHAERTKDVILRKVMSQSR